jgi:hypothetical protein
VNHAKNQLPNETARRSPRQALSNPATRNTTVRLPAVPTGSVPTTTAARIEEAAHRPPSATRRGAWSRDLVLGAMLAMVLLAACLAWEAMSRGDDPVRPGADHAAASLAPAGAAH